MAYPMSPDEIQAFLSYGRRTGKVATVRADGRPHVAPIWFIVDGQDLVFMTGADTVKGKSLLRDPRVALTVDLEESPYGFVMVEGRAEISTDLDAMLPLSIEIARRYMGDERAEEFGTRNAVDGELLIRLHPDKTVALNDLTG
jgi:PPOX class probable F420-dependent enzyme